MKAILFFIKGSNPSPADFEAAKVIAAETKNKVVFRNASAATYSGESPEPNEGVAGRVPDSYSGSARYDLAGKRVSPEERPAVDPNAAPKPMNAIGLPEGSPEDKAGVKAALDAKGVEYHPNAQIGTLVKIFRKEILGID